MKIEEAKALEEELEVAILRLLGDFEEKTGLHVVGVELGRMNVSSFDEAPGKTVLGGVMVDTLL